MKPITESKIETTILEWLTGLGSHVIHGPNIEPQIEGAEQADYVEVLLELPLQDASGRLNPDLERLEILSYFPR